MSSGCRGIDRTCRGWYLLMCTTLRTCRHSTSSGLRWGPFAPMGGTARGRRSGPVRGRRPGGVVGGLLGLILLAPTIRHGRAPVVVEEPVWVERRMSINAVDYRGCAADALPLPRSSGDARRKEGGHSLSSSSPELAPWSWNSKG